MSVRDRDGGEQRTPATSHLSPSERAAAGKAARAEVPRSSHAALDSSAGRDPLGLLESQDESRLPELVPIRYGRMLASSFAFFRGAAVVMAHDLATTPTSGLTVQLSGDAHLLNFGGFASPERDLVFDLNDFDETLAGPFEWDVKRLATSFEIAGRERNFSKVDRRNAVITAVRSYRRAMSRFAEMGDLDVWYARLDAKAIDEDLHRARDRKLRRTVRRSEARAHRHDRMHALAKLTREADGEPRIVSDPPLVVPISELADGRDEANLGGVLHGLFRRYRKTLPDERRVLLEQFRYADLARKVVGIGSVGTRCWVMLLLGRDEHDPLFLQIKEAQPSVLEPLLGRSPYATHGQRVVEGQRLTQAASDIFIGWIHSEAEIDGAHDFYVRQLWDWKTSIDLAQMRPRELSVYAKACGWTLARAHARSGDPIAIAAYLGRSDRFDRALAKFSAAYANLNDLDYRALARAAADGRVTATKDV